MTRDEIKTALHSDRLLLLIEETLTVVTDPQEAARAVVEVVEEALIGVELAAPDA